MKYLNSLEAYYVVGGQDDGDDGDDGSSVFDVDIYVGGGRAVGAEEFFERHPERKPK